MIDAAANLAKCIRRRVSDRLAAQPAMMLASVDALQVYARFGSRVMVNPVDVIVSGLALLHASQALMPSLSVRPVDRECLNDLLGAADPADTDVHVSQQS